MEDLRIETREELAAWLESHHGFPDLFVLRMEPRPQLNGVPLLERVTMELATQIEGGFAAGERRTLRVFELTAEGTETFWIENLRRYDAAFCNDAGLRQLDIDRPGLQFEVPARVQLVCGALTVHELSDRTEIIQPWINDAELAAHVRGYELPTPGDWIELFAQEGVSVVWRRFQEGPQVADSVPADYTGWYLQEPERFATGGGDGIFFFGATSRPGSFVAHVQNHDPQNADLWRALQRILLHYPQIEIRSGNCRLDAAQWQQYVKEGYIT
jgi:hypothetical protein